MEDNDLELARRFSSRLRGMLGARVLGVRVFGSRARGEAHSGSDLDLAVLLDLYDRETRNRVLDLAWELNTEIGFVPAISPTVMGREEFESMLDRERRLALDIRDEGVPVDT